MNKYFASVLFLFRFGFSCARRRFHFFWRSVCDSSSLVALRTTWIHLNSTRSKWICIPLHCERRKVNIIFVKMTQNALFRFSLIFIKNHWLHARLCSLFIVEWCMLISCNELDKRRARTHREPNRQPDCSNQMIARQRSQRGEKAFLVRWSSAGLTRTFTWIIAACYYDNNSYPPARARRNANNKETKRETRNCTHRKSTATTTTTTTEEQQHRQWSRGRKKKDCT